MRMYAAYDNDAIYGFGSTPDAALADTEQYGATGLRTAPCTKYMATKIERDGCPEEFGVIRGTVVSSRAYWRLSGNAV